jgi:hypothetical protein
VGIVLQVLINVPSKEEVISSTMSYTIFKFSILFHCQRIAGALIMDIPQEGDLQ